MKRHKIGTEVSVMLEGALVRATVVGHGRDSQGIYTEVRYADGGTGRIHRDSVYAIPEPKRLL